MTLSIAWLRKVGDCEELIMVSDSRLTGGGTRWDQCSKIALLPRTDSAICFAGSTNFAYPLMEQLYFAISSYGRLKDGAMDLHDLKGHTLKVFNQLQQSVKFEVTYKKDLWETEFILGGYSWIRKQFSFWRIHYNKGTKLFEAKPASKIGKFGEVIFAGDWANDGKKALISYLQDKYGRNVEDADVKGFNYEPFEVLRDLLRTKTASTETIGGPPQMVKVYQHMNCKPIGIYWPNKEASNRTILGRTLLEYEDTDYWFIDPDTLISERRVGKKEM